MVSSGLEQEEGCFKSFGTLDMRDALGSVIARCRVYDSMCQPTGLDKRISVINYMKPRYRPESRFSSCFIDGQEDLNCNFFVLARGCRSHMIAASKVSAKRRQKSANLAQVSLEDCGSNLFLNLNRRTTPSFNTTLVHQLH